MGDMSKHRTFSQAVGAGQAGVGSRMDSTLLPLRPAFYCLRLFKSENGTYSLE